MTNGILNTHLKDAYLAECAAERNCRSERVDAMLMLDLESSGSRCSVSEEDNVDNTINEVVQSDFRGHGQLGSDDQEEESNLGELVKETLIDRSGLLNSAQNKAHNKVVDPNASISMSLINRVFTRIIPLLLCVCAGTRSPIAARSQRL